MGLQNKGQFFMGQGKGLGVFLLLCNKSSLFRVDTNLVLHSHRTPPSIQFRLNVELHNAST